MSNIVVAQGGGALAMSETELMAVLSNSLYPGAKPESIKMVIGYCKASGLDPMQKPVHIVPMWDSKARGMRDVIMPGIGSYRTQAARSGEYAGISEPEFGEDVTETFPEESYYDSYSKENKKRGSVSVTFPAWCRVVVKRLLPNGTMAEFAATERWKENYATASKDSAQPNAMWKRRPYAQLAKCAEAQALRKAFPEFGAQPTADEMAGKSLNDDETVIDAGTGEIIRPTAARTPQDAAAQNAPAGYEDYEVEHLQAMRDAAMNGTNALTEAFRNLPKSAHKNAFWQKHGEALKEAAKAATVIDAQTGEVAQ